MVDMQQVQKWLDNYVSAWKTYDKAAIEALFSEDAGYRYNPYDEPVRGREAIVTNWLKNRDEPNTYRAEYQPLAINGNTAVTQGQSIHYKPDGTTILRKFDNIFVLKFDDEGRCEDF